MDHTVPLLIVEVVGVDQVASRPQLLLILLILHNNSVFHLKFLSLNLVSYVSDELTKLSHNFIFAVLTEFLKNRLLTLRIAVEEVSGSQHKGFLKQLRRGVFCLQDLHDHLTQL